MPTARPHPQATGGTCSRLLIVPFAARGVCSAESSPTLPSTTHARGIGSSRRAVSANSSRRAPATARPPWGTQSTRRAVRGQ
eukprot:scaffold44115_cov60-Phaeocystis_antarctica.AAC.1